MPRCYIVPGFLCSALWRTGPGVDSYWADVSALIYRGIDPLRLDAAGNDPGSPGGEALFPFGAVGLYWDKPATQLLAQIKPHGYETFVWGWDWRKRILDGGALLGAHILAEIDPTEPCVLACHSAGGLLARAAWSWLGDRGQTGLIRRIVTLGTPHWGTYEPVNVWTGGGSLMSQLKWILNSLAFGANSVPVSGGRRFWSDDDIIALTQTWPGLYDLMPVIGAPDTEDDTARPALFDAANYAPGRRPSQTHLDHARDVTGPWLRSSASMPPTEVITSVIGSGYSTRARLDPDWSPNIRGSSLQAGSGDGVVTSSSAAAALSVAYDWSVLHGDMPTASVQGGYLADMLLAVRTPPDPPPPPVTIGGIVPFGTTLPPLVATAAGCPPGASRADGSCSC